MKERDNKSFSKLVEKVKSTELVVHEVESDSVIVNLDGWRMRVYLEKSFNGHLAIGSTINVDYTGDLDNPHSVKFEKLKQFPQKY